MESNGPGTMPWNTLCRPVQGDDLLHVFLANTRSAKGRASELAVLTCEYNIVCLTETYIDDTVPDHCVIATPIKRIFRKDRTLHGGKVLIVGDCDLKPSKVITQSTSEEITS